MCDRQIGFSPKFTENSHFPADTAHRRGSSSQCSVQDGEGVEGIQDDEEAAMARHPSSFSSIPDEPPEPPIPAPGAQEDDLQNYPPEQYSLLDALSAELTGMANGFVPQWLGTSPPAQLNGIGLNRTSAGFPAVIHQRSVSDQQLHCGQVERRRQMELGMGQETDGQQVNYWDFFDKFIQFLILISQEIKV